MSAAVLSPIRLNPKATLWEYLALPDEELERADLVAMNLSVAKGIESLKDLEVARYVRIVDEWTNEFARRLPASEEVFKRNPQKYKNDIHFYRVGMLQLFLGSIIGIRYNLAEMKAKSVWYTNPNSLFLNGVIDTKIGTCGNMATLHVAMSRRMGWPVSLALAKNHQLSRFDDGQVVHNIETSKSHAGMFSSGSDEDYINYFKLPPKSKKLGADLRKLTAREMMGVFVGGRARHYQDISRFDLCDVECCLARHLLPAHRPLYCLAMTPYLSRGKALFDSEEIGHPIQLYQELAAEYGNRCLPIARDAKIFEPRESLQGLFGGRPLHFVPAPPRQTTRKPVIHTIMATPVMINGTNNFQKKG